MDFSEDQIAYIEEPLTNNVYLRACPGSGKTEVIAAKVAKEARGWSHFPAGIAVLSFSRSATHELEERITRARRGSRSTFPHFVGTVDSFFLKKIVNQLAHRLTSYKGLDGDFSIRLMDEYAVCFHRTKYKICHERVSANRFDWDPAASRFVFRHPVLARQRELNSLSLEQYQIDDLIEAKAAFNANGFATYKDVEQFALEILSNDKFDEYVRRLVARYPHIMIDECQDLSKDQIKIFDRLASKGVSFHLIGDLEQAIYLFRNCNPIDVANFVRKIGCKDLLLQQNFRSGQNIVDLHGALIRSDKVKGQTDYAETTCYLVEYRDCPSEALGIFDELAASHDRSVIVARGYSTLHKMRVGEVARGTVQMLAAAIANFVRSRPGDLYNALSAFSQYLAEECIQQNTKGREAFWRPEEMQSAFEWHRFLSDCLSVFVKEGLAKQSITWSAWCALHKKALSRLETISSPNPDCKKILKALIARQHRTPSGLGSTLVEAVVSSQDPCIEKRRLATIHEVKGETHDLTMLVSSSRQGEQAHWKEWLGSPTSEGARFAYVASSRPRHILIWAVKTLKKEEREALMSLGFQKSLQL
nr:ATP-dependent helicase [uncultured Undibacterium sp.]